GCRRCHPFRQRGARCAEVSPSARRNDDPPFAFACVVLCPAPVVGPPPRILRWPMMALTATDQSLLPVPRREAPECATSVVDRRFWPVQFFEKGRGKVRSSG